MSNKNILIITMITILMILTGIIFFFIGRSSVDVDVVYLPGETVTDSIPYPVPYEVEVPSKPKYIIVRDTLRDTIPGSPFVIIEKVDTAAILADWVLKRTYMETLFDNDTLGKFDLSFYVQYNQAANIKYRYTPMVKNIVREKTFVPYVGLGYNIIGVNKPLDIKAGVFIKNIGIEGSYMTDFSGFNGYRIGIVNKY